MVREAFNFDDELLESGVTVIVETTQVYDADILKKDGKGLYLYLDAHDPGVAASAYIPRKQPKKIIKAMKAVLNEE